MCMTGPPLPPQKQKPLVAEILPEMRFSVVEGICIWGCSWGNSSELPRLPLWRLGSWWGQRSVPSSTQRMPHEGSEVFSAKYLGPGVKNTPNNSLEEINY